MPDKNIGRPKDTYIPLYIFDIVGLYYARGCFAPRFCFCIFKLEVLSISAKEYTINEQIRASQIRVVDNDGEQLGIMTVKDALKLAYDKGFDLVEIAPAAKPPVCRIMDYGKYRFESEKKEKESRKKQVVIETKEVKLTCRIGQHDLDTKLNHAKRFLTDGNKVKFTIVFSGREMHHTDIGYEVMKKITESCADFGQPDKQPSLYGRYMTMIVSPKQKDHKESKESKEQKEKATENK